MAKRTTFAALALILAAGPLFGQDSPFYRPKAADLAEWRKAAEQGDVFAQYMMGTYCNDDAEGARWYRKAADQGNALGQLMLGTMYHEGVGVPKNDVEAARWWRKAADQGNADAQFDIGVLYREGKTVTQSYAEAVVWYRKAADQGHPQAQFNLGAHYLFGQGVPQNYVEAHMWQNLAASRATGEDQAKFSKARDALSRMMTPQQIAEAQRRALAWVPVNRGSR